MGKPEAVMVDSPAEARVLEHGQGPDRDNNRKYAIGPG